MRIKPRALLLGALVVAASLTCMRLGVWQLARMRTKHALHAAQRALLALEPIEVVRAIPAVSPPSGRRVHVTGRWDRSLHVLLSGRTHLGAAGVWLVTGVRLPSGEIVLVERGWLEAADSRIAHPEHLADSTADVIGVALALERAAHPTAWSALAPDVPGVRLWSARSLDVDSLAARVTGPLAPWCVLALPDGGARAAAALPQAGPRPIPEPYQVPDEAMHLSYAIQWFAFAAIIGIGSLALAARNRASKG